jgi:hypothetical protein
MATTPIQEYLVALGFRLDSPGYRRFGEMLQGTAKDFAGLAEQSAAAASAVGLAVEKIASQYEQLYYLSQRTGAKRAKPSGHGLRFFAGWLGRRRRQGHD